MRPRIQCVELPHHLCPWAYVTSRRKPLEGFKIIVDAGNGAGGFFVGKVLAPLGADTTGSQFLEPGAFA